MKIRNLNGGHVLIDGAIDTHVHFGPEPLVDLISGTTHSVDPIQAAQEARDHGLSAIVLKAHEFPSTMAAFLAQQAVPEVKVIASITCDHPVGGVNPIAVETALRNGAGVVWLPTVSSVTSTPERLQLLFHGAPGYRIIDADGSLLPEVQEVIELVRQYGAVLATGHTTADEHYAVVKALAGTGAPAGPGRVVVTHAMQEGAGPNLSVAQCIELAELGAFIEFAAHSCMAEPARQHTVAAAIASLPPAQVILSSDYGWNANLPHPSQGLQSYVSAMWELGLDEDDLTTMVTDNPRELLQI